MEFFDGNVFKFEHLHYGGLWTVTSRFDFTESESENSKDKHRESCPK